MPGINTDELEEWAIEVIGITDISNVFLIQMKLRDGLVDHHRSAMPMPWAPEKSLI